MRLHFKLIFICVFYNSLVFSQDKQVYISKKTVEVGEIFSIRYEYTYPFGSTFAFIPPSKNFPCTRISSNSSLKGEKFNDLEVITYSDSSYHKGNDIVWYADFKLIAWDTGTLVLEGMPFSTNDMNDQFTSILMEAFLVKPIKKVSIYDIKENFTPLNKKFEIKEFLSDNKWYLVGVIIIILCIVYILKRNKKAKVPIKPKSLKEITLESIDVLAKKELWIHDEKAHYTELSFILRWYLTVRFSISLLERTTSETFTLLRLKKLDPDSIDKINEVLTHSDYVKFASSRLDENIHIQLIQRLRQIVIETSPIEIENV